jgi:hypothetical protein
MTVTLNELLMLAGRLDDSSGFDTPRERFRRFLIEHVTDAHAARALIDQCQHAPGDQHHRALQDVVVVLGKCLGFEARFGSYLSTAKTRKPDGQWHSRRLDVILEIRTDQTEPGDLDSLSRSVAAVSGKAQGGGSGRVLGLCVLTPLYANRSRLEEIQDSVHPDSRVRLVTLRSLLTVAGMFASKRLTHDDVVRLLGSGLELDFVVQLLERAAGTLVSHDVPAPAPVPVSVESQAGTNFWLATIAADQGATPEQFVDVVIGKRQIFGVAENGAARATAQPGDRLCFYIPGKGVVGHSQVRSIAESSSGIRDAQRFSQLLHLENTVLHVHSPVPLEEELQLRLRAARTARDKGAHPLVRISSQEFTALALSREAEERVVRNPPSAYEDDAEGDPVSVGDSRSRE